MNRKKTRYNFILVLVSAIILVMLLAVCVFAAASTINLSVNQLSASYVTSVGTGNRLGGGDGSADVQLTGGNEFMAEAKSAGKVSFGGKTYPKSSVTVTLANNYGTNATLQFGLEISPANGTVTVNGVEKKNGDFITETVSGEGGTVEIVVASAETKVGKTGGIKVKVTGIQLDLIEDKFSADFQPGEHGSYTVDGVSVGAGGYKPDAKKATEAYKVEAKAEDGYIFWGWKNETTKAYFENVGASGNIIISSDCTIRPIFIKKDAALFGVGTQLFADLNEANDCALREASNKTIVLMEKGTLQGSATISPGITLLIPYNEAASVNISQEPDTVDNAIGQTVFRYLTIPNGVTLTVEGNISVNGQALKNTSVPTGPYGLIKLQEGGEIVLKNGANLFCWGYISGDGMVTAESGSNVYECFQLTGWRGGQASSSLISDKKVFPVNQYYIQNVEAALKIEQGATEYVYASVVVKLLGQQNVTTKFISVNEGMFHLKEKGSSLIKRYIPETDRMEFQIDGKFEISSIYLKFGGSYSLNSKDFPLPINCNFSIIINSGTTTVTSVQDLAMLPGSELMVAQDAILNINSKMYVYDQDNWGDYAYNKKLRQVNYVATRNGKPQERTEADLIDAKIDVNGTINISEEGAKGRLFTTSGGANITSSQGNGVINFKTATDNSITTYQATQTSEKVGMLDVVHVHYHDIPCKTAKLRNGDGSYLETTGAKGPENGKPGWSYTYLTTDPEYEKYTDTNVYKDMWYRYRVIYKVNGHTTVKYITTDSDTFDLDPNIPLTGDKRPVVTTNNATATLDTTSRKIVLSEINGDCIVEFTSETVYKINVSWTGNLNFEYKPNIYRWDAATMCYIREQEAGWRSNEPTVRVTNDRESGSTGNIKADVAFEKKAEFSNSDLGMNFTIGDSTTPNSVTMSDKLIPGKSVTAKMQLTGAPTGLASGANLTIGTVKIILTTVT